VSTIPSDDWHRPASPAPTRLDGARPGFASQGPLTIDETVRRRFEEAWLGGNPQPIEGCLPARNDPFYLATLEELIHIEMEFAGGPDAPSPRVEAYLERFPDLDAPAIVLRLLRQECRVRQRLGERPDAGEYRGRFSNLIGAGWEPGMLDVPDDAPTRPGKVEGYEVEATLGQGGMGIVYKARQARLNRTVALKMLLPQAIAGPEDLRRFRTEVEATAALRHPHIVRVFEFGECGGRPFYSMEFIDGPSLEERLGRGTLAGRAAARYLAPVARAVQHAHDHGILHRDLKPSNILLDGDDRPHVTDFGIAKRLAGGDERTRTGAIVGSPSYMAPEQAAGRKEVGPAADVYGLGSLLYALLTGRPPFLGETLTDTLLQVLESEPAPPRLLNPNVDRDLETICLKCLNKQPERRYASAAALADDLDRYLAGESIAARSVNLFDRLARTLGRGTHDAEFHSWGTLLLLLGVVVFVCHIGIYAAGAAGLSWLRWSISAAEFALIGVVFVRKRPGRLLPTSAAERQLWAIWIGYFLAFFTLASIDVQVVDHDIERSGPANQWSIYPYSTLLAGFAFFVMGSSYWGGCYLIGAGFFICAALMPKRLGIAPLVFAVVWSAALCVLGLRLRRLAREASPPPRPPSAADVPTLPPSSGEPPGPGT
jgi:tRNA A-37 threonylcarbamoyl transferase component Bud32